MFPEIENRSAVFRFRAKRACVAYHALVQSLIDIKTNSRVFPLSERADETTGRVSNPEVRCLSGLFKPVPGIMKSGRPLLNR